MGITGFYKWLKEDYKDCFLSHDKNKNIYIYDNVYIDLNYLLHMALYNTNNMDGVIDKLEIIIYNICKRTNPLKTLNLSSDGTSPYAKLLLQKDRRQQNISTDLNTSLHFTPNTKFMNQLESRLSKMIETLKLMYNIQVKCNFDGDGEAELKNKKLFLSNKNLSDTHIFVTSDADVVLIMSSVTHYNNIFIMTYGKTSDILSLKLLLNSHCEKYGKSLTFNYDFCFLNMLLGNDYFPEVKGLNINNIWDGYKKKFKKVGLINKDCIINKKFLLDILDYCIIHSTKISLNRSTLNTFNKNIYDNYLDGLTWCFDMYNRGECVRNNYIFILNDEKATISLFVLYIYLKSNLNDMKLNRKQCNAIPKILCSLLLIPEQVKELIDEEYHKYYKLLNVEKANQSKDIDKILEKYNKLISI
jgi:5'-3' exonuclease